jgi:hypothetical protein
MDIWSHKALESTIMNLRRVFDAQVHTLEQLACPTGILKTLQAQRSETITNAATLALARRRVPFLPIIPRRRLSIDTQMSMVRNAGFVGYSWLNPDAVSDVVSLPDDCYFIFVVEDGTQTRDTAPQDVENASTRQKRRCVTLPEAISLCIHTDVLGRQNLFAAASRYQRDHVPDVYLFGGVPRLGWYEHRNRALQHWATPSCVASG